jgi:hypothetical protein
MCDFSGHKFAPSCREGDCLCDGFSHPVIICTNRMSEDWNMDSATGAQISTAVATIVLVGVGIWGVIEINHSLTLSQRAWVVPTGAVFRAETPSPGPNLQNNRPIHFIVAFLNSGKEAGVDVNYAIRNYIIDSYDPSRTSVETLVIPDNHTCRGLVAQKGRPAFAPNAVVGVTLDSVHGEPPLVADDRIIKGTKFYVVQGCISYVTFAEIHRSGFCYILENVPGRSNPLAFRICARGFYID